MTRNSPGGTRHRRMARAGVVVAGLAGLLVAGPGHVTATAATGAVHGCPRGAVCVFPQDMGFNGDHPSSIFYSYGAHNLSNQVGTHRVLDNQYGGAIDYSCGGYNGTGRYLDWNLDDGSWHDENLTPVNSIVLKPSESDFPSTNYC